MITVEEIKNSTKKLIYKLNGNIAEVIRVKTGILIGNICIYSYDELLKCTKANNKILNNIFEVDEDKN